MPSLFFKSRSPTPQKAETLDSKLISPAFIIALFESMEITEEQLRRAEDNRLAALEKRKRTEERLRDGPWRFFRCRKIPSSTSSSSSSALVPEKKPSLLPRVPEPPEPLKRFLVVLEICSPDEFAVLPEPLPGFIFPGVVECFRIIEAALVSVLHFRISESQGSQGCLRAFVYKLNDYDLVLKCLRKLSIADLQDIPYITLLAIRSFQDHVSIGCIPCWKEHYSEKQVDDLILKLPRTLQSALLPFQLDGVRFGLLRGARCLIADEMGLGKTIQAIAIAACFIDKGPILIVCPAVLRFSWAEELEHWLPSLLPRDLHLVFGRQNSLDYLEHCPKIVVISYTMLSRLRRSMLNREWALMIVDESHNLRCTKKKSEHKETQIVLDIATKIDHIVLLSGTPSLTRPFDIYHQVNILWPGLLGKDKYEFAKSYCKVKVAHGSQGSTYKDFSKGVRLEELNVLLREYVMIRRLKEHVLTQLPPKRRQIIMLKLKVADISIATTLSRVNSGFSGDVNVSNQSVVDNHVDQNDIDRSKKSGSFNLQDGSRGNSKLLTFQEIGIAKLSGFREWFSSHVADEELENAHNLGIGFGSQKFIIFAHHIKVLDGIQEFVCEKGIQFVRIDGRTLSKDRKTAVESFRLSSEVRIAIIGITAGGVGLDFSSAQNVVFLELPKSASEMLQAEDRAHRRGQTNAVNIYIFCAKGTCDESHWMHLNRSLFGVSSMMNGKYDAVKEIEVNGVLQLDNPAYGVGTNEVAIRAYTCKGEHRVQSITKNITLTQPLESEICIPDKESMKLDSAEKIPNKEGFQQLQIITVDGTYCEVDTCEEGLIKEEYLRFEVSHYTGRIHLYICLPGMDLRPRPLFVNFRQEELDSIVLLICLQEKESVSQLVKENPRYFNMFQTFIEEWNSLRPIERCKLLGKPLQLPLSIELCYLKEATNHGSSGLLKGGSKRRVTPLSEISHTLPENAVWKKVVLHGCSSKGKEYTQAFSVGGKPLCKLCHVPCNGKLSTVPEFFEDLFCNIGCFQEYRIRTSQKALRKELFGIEHGVCVMCSLDCHKLVKSLMPLSIANRRSYVEKIAPGLAKKKKLLDKLVCAPVEGNAWHADHIVPVFKGGGECRLENMRTLCVACHAKVTKAQGVERRLARKRAREQLKITMKLLEHSDDGENKGGCSTLSSGALEVVGSDGAVGGEASEDMLLVHVPGSAYSETRDTSPRES